MIGTVLSLSFYSETKMSSFSRSHLAIAFSILLASFGLYGFTSIVLELPNLLPSINWIDDVPFFDHFAYLQQQFNQLPSNVLDTVNPPEPECRMTAPQLIEHLGYPAEVHHVITLDGYILELHRIPYGKNGVGSDPRVPVYVQHGLASSSADFVNNMANQSLGFVLADSGYDVWLGNIRGNTYSTNHTKLKPTEKLFWNFSYDEMAKFDLPAIIDYILATTSHSQLYYVGHSMGTTMGFALFSSTTKYDTKIKRFVAIGPVGVMAHIGCIPCATLAPFSDDVYDVLITAGVYHLLDNDNSSKYFAETACSVAVADLACSGILDVTGGPSDPQLNRTRLPIYFSHYPATVSTRTLTHFGQNFRDKVFRRFDLGTVENLLVYKKLTPPIYDVTKINVHVALIYSLTDLLASPEDAVTLESKLKYLDGSLQLDKISHQNLIWSSAAELPVNDYVLKMLALQ